MYTVIIVIACVIVGFVAGALASNFRWKSHMKQIRIGKLRMDDATGDQYLFLELSVPIEIALQNTECIVEVDLTPLTQD